MRTMLPVCSIGGLAAIWRTCSSLPPQPDLHASEDVDLAAGAMGQMNVARAGGDRELDASVDRQRALKGSLGAPSAGSRQPTPKLPLQERDVSFVPRFRRMWSGKSSQMSGNLFSIRLATASGIALFS